MSLMGDDLVYWSVAEANRQRGHISKPMGMKCPHCGTDDWYARNGVSSEYASAYNPGEYVAFSCAQCGYSFEEQS